MKLVFLDEKEIYPYVTEGIGEDILPENVDFDLIDAFEKVTDKDAAIYTRKLAREEGIFCRKLMWSCHQRGLTTQRTLWT